MQSRERAVKEKDWEGFLGTNIAEFTDPATDVNISCSSKRLFTSYYGDTKMKTGGHLRAKIGAMRNICMVGERVEHVKWKKNYFHLGEVVKVIGGKTHVRWDSIEQISKKNKKKDKRITVHDNSEITKFCDDRAAKRLKKNKK